MYSFFSPKCGSVSVAVRIARTQKDSRDCHVQLSKQIVGFAEEITPYHTITVQQKIDDSQVAMSLSIAYLQI